jgi:hypothetical protein
MADTTPVVHIGENSPEQVAFKLLQSIAGNEGKKLSGATPTVGEYPDKKWLLDTYAECLHAVKGYRKTG